MGPPALYIVGGVVVAAGAVIAFKELVYDPYIHPRIEAYFARLEGRRLARAHLAEAQFLTEQRPVSYPVRRPKDVELRDVRRRKNYVDVDETPTPPRSPLPGPSTSRQFGLQTPTPTESLSTHQEQAPLIDLGPFADPLIETAAAAPHTRDRSTPSLLRTPPPPPGMGIMRPSAPGPAPVEDDDDLVLSFISDRLRAQRHGPSPEHGRGSSSPAEEHEDVIRLPMPSSSPSSPRALTSETFVPPEPRSPSMRTMSSASASSRAISPFAVDSRAISPFAVEDSHSFDNYHSGTGTGTLRRSVLSPIPSSSLTAAHRSPPGQPSPPPYRPGPPSPRSPTMSASSWSLTSDPDAEWHASDADEVEFDFADADDEHEHDRRNGEFDGR
ncbi:hypothetical protein EXIGLDRAFT_841733, partial [Exidia glandulosa HHB12029]